MSIRILILIFLMMLAGPISAAELKSPWDASSPPVAQGAKLSCPASPKLPASLSTTGYYAKGGEEVDRDKLEEYSRDTVGIRQGVRRVVSMADAYRTSGDAAQAVCAGRWISQFAADRVLAGKMVGPQSYYFRTWMLNALAVAWLKIRPVVVDQQGIDSALIKEWFRNLAQDTTQYFEGRDSRAGTSNNLRYWAGAAVMSASIASNDRKGYEWGMNSFFIGVDSVDGNGMLTNEMKRGSRAMHYHSFSVGPLILMAELGRSNGDSTYERNDFAIKRLLGTVFRAYKDPVWFGQLVGVKQRTPDPKRVTFGWYQGATKRLGLSEYHDLIANYPQPSSLYLGGLPPSF